MSLLKIRITEFERGVAVQILEQDPEQIARAHESLCWTDNAADFRIRSEERPELGMHSIWLRGNRRDGDSKIATINFHDNETRDRWLRKLKDALTEWSARGGFRPKPKVEAAALPPDVFEF